MIKAGMRYFAHCPYCIGPVDLVSGKVIYPDRLDLADRLYYLCKPCNAYVGTHPGTSIPLGTIASAELRAARRSAHQAFDEIWKSRGLSRKGAYGWLSKELGLPIHLTHIGYFDTDQCRRVRELVTEKWGAFARDPIT